MTLFELAAVLTLNKSAFDKGIGEAEGQAQGLGEKLKSGLAGGIKATAGALTASTGAVVSFGKSAVEAGQTFDSSMSQVAATMGTTVDEIQDLRDFAQEMGAATAFSASQAADALNYMALASYDADKSMEMLPNVLNLAAAGGIDLAYASDMITDSQSALGLTMDETAELVDKMAKASSKSNTSVEQLGEAILTVGGTAKTLAGGTTELSTALGILADNGVKGAEGGTALRNIILSLSAPTDTAAKAMKSLGLEVFDAEGNMRPLNETFGDLNNALSTMTQGEQTQVLNQIFNKVDLKSVNALLANANERFDELSGYIDDAAGAAQAMADTQLDNLSGDITLFQSAMEGAQIMLSDQLTPTLRNFVQFATDGIGDITKAFSEGGMEGGFAAIGEVLSNGIAMIADYIPEFVKAGRLLLENLVYGIIENAPVLVQGFSDILNDAIGALPEFFSNVGELISNAIQNIIPIISSAVPLIGEGIKKALPELAKSAVSIISTLASGLKDNIGTIVSTVVDVAQTIVETLTDPETLTGILDAGLQILMSLGQGILDAIPTLLESLPLVVDNIIQFFLSAIPMIIDTGVQLLSSLVSNLPTIIQSVVSALPTLINSIINGILSAIPLIIDAGVELLISLISNLPTIISTIVGAIPTIISAISEGILGNLDKIIMAGVQLFVSLIQNLPTIIVEIVKAVPQIIGGIVDAFGSLAGSIVDIGVNLLKGIWDGICSAADWLWGQIEGFFGGIVDGICDFLGIHSPSRVFAEIGNNMALGVGEGWDDEFSDIQKDINKQMDFSGSADLTMNYRTNTYSGAYGEDFATVNAAASSGEKQPILIVVQLESGLELARALIDDINNAKRIDGYAY